MISNTFVMGDIIMENHTYADAFGILASLTDIKIDFAITQPQIGEDGKIVGDNKIFEHRIILSLPLAKDLAKKLAGAVADYEKDFGSVLDLGEVQENLQNGQANE